MDERLTPAEMRERLRGRTVSAMFAAATTRCAAQPALRTRAADGAWTTWTYAEYGDRAARVAGALAAVGVGAGDRVSLLVRNRPEFHALDMGTLLLRATPTSMYNTSCPEQIRYLMEKTESQVVVVDGAQGLDRLRAAAPFGSGPRTVIVLDDLEGGPGDDVLSWADLQAADPVDLHDLAGRVRPEDLATIIFTSGTTGPSKGAMLTHSTVCATVEGLAHALGSQFTGKRLLSYMPMAHIAERGNTLYLPLRDGHDVACVADLPSLLAYLPAVRPQYLFGPPRIWEKLWAGLQQAMAGADVTRRAAWAHALEVGRSLLPTRRSGAPLNAEEAARWARVQTDARGLLAVAALDAIEFAVTAAAAMPPAVLDGLLAIGLPIADAYGQTECGIGAMDLHTHRVGTVGRPMSGTALRLATDGEIELDSAGSFVGYLGDPERTAETLTSDGWLRTGDVGTLDAGGYLTLVDRKKDLIITAGGKNISPSNIEGKLVRHPLVANALVVGEGRRFLSALLVPDPLTAPDWAARHGLDGDLATLCTEPAFLAELQILVDEVNDSLARVERVKRFAVVGEAWSPDSAELTPTMKVRRRVVEEKHAELIDALYL